MTESVTNVLVRRLVISTLAAVIIFALLVEGVRAGRYFDKDDERALQHLSGALMAWYETNKLGQPRGDAEMQHVLDLLGKVHSECALVPDKTLAKIEAEFATQWRENLQEGARQYQAGLRAYWKAAKSGGKPTQSEKSQSADGQQKMVRFHTYYNANIERIAAELKAKGVDIF